MKLPEIVEAVVVPKVEQYIGKNVFANAPFIVYVPVPEELE